MTTALRSIHVYTLDADGQIEARDMTPAEAETALRLHLVLARLPERAEPRS